MKKINPYILSFFCLFFIGACSQYSSQLKPRNDSTERVGVLFVSHGGNEVFNEKGIWDVTVQIFSYDENSPLYRNVLWNEEFWPKLLKYGNAQKNLGKYSFEYERIGGIDPYPAAKRKVTKELTRILNQTEKSTDIDFVVDNMTWISPEIDEIVHPRRLYNPGVEGGSILRFCDSEWRRCRLDRFDVDGPVERLLSVGVDRIIMIDLTTAGARFSKTYDSYQIARELINDHNKKNDTDVVLEWANDPRSAMDASYPVSNTKWTRSSRAADSNPLIDIESYPNPVISDQRLAEFHVQGIEKRFSEEIPMEETGVLLVNHGIFPGAELFDPKINDTLILNNNIKDALIQKHPGLKSSNILGGWFGEFVVNEELEGRSKLERSREMRGENLGYIRLLDEKSGPTGEMGYRYWQGLEALKTNGVRHIVIAFPQIMENSVLNLVEVPNQMAKEIGYKGWLEHNGYDFDRYPKVGHPFADYWGVWVRTMCKNINNKDIEEPCCFEMGGCSNNQPYPPLRQAAINQQLDDLDPSLAYDVSAYGHLGYDPDLGLPSDEFPVQNQYTGSWAMWDVTENHKAVAQFLADKIIEHIELNEGEGS